MSTRYGFFLVSSNPDSPHRSLANALSELTPPPPTSQTPLPEHLHCLAALILHGTRTRLGGFAFGRYLPILHPTNFHGMGGSCGGDEVARLAQVAKFTGSKKSLQGMRTLDALAVWDFVPVDGGVDTEAEEGEGAVCRGYVRHISSGRFLIAAGLFDPQEYETDTVENEENFELWCGQQLELRADPSWPSNVPSTPSPPTKNLDLDPSPSDPFAPLTFWLGSEDQDDADLFDLVWNDSETDSEGFLSHLNLRHVRSGLYLSKHFTRRPGPGTSRRHPILKGTKQRGLFALFIHRGEKCSTCSMRPMIGPRYRCLEKGCGFQCCFKCYSSNSGEGEGTTHSHHDVSRHVMPTFVWGGREVCGICSEGMMKMVEGRKFRLANMQFRGLLPDIVCERCVVAKSKQNEWSIGDNYKSSGVAEPPSFVPASQKLELMPENVDLLFAQPEYGPMAEILSFLDLKELTRSFCRVGREFARMWNVNKETLFTKIRPGLTLEEAKMVLHPTKGVGRQLMDFLARVRCFLPNSIRRRGPTPSVDQSVPRDISYSTLSVPLPEGVDWGRSNGYTLRTAKRVSFLIYAAIIGCPDALSIMVNEIDPTKGDVALACRLMFGNRNRKIDLAPVVESLIRMVQFDVKMGDEVASYALNMSCSRGWGGVTIAILQREPPFSNEIYLRALQQAAQYNHVDQVRTLLACPGFEDPGAEDNRVFVSACGNGNTEVVNVMLEDGRIDPNVHPARRSDDTNKACKNGQAGVMRLLMHHPSFTGARVALKMLLQVMLKRWEDTPRSQVNKKRVEAVNLLLCYPESIRPKPPKLLARLSLRLGEEFDSSKFEAIRSAVDANRCTVNVTGQQFQFQRFFECLTCRLADGQGCCESCARVCHAGHQVVEAPISPCGAFCDCGADNRACRGVN